MLKSNKLLHFFVLYSLFLKFFFSLLVGESGNAYNTLKMETRHTLKIDIYSHLLFFIFRHSESPKCLSFEKYHSWKYEKLLVVIVFMATRCNRTIKQWGHILTRNCFNAKFFNTKESEFYEDFRDKKSKNFVLKKYPSK